jgi:hypothetical protein
LKDLTIIKEVSSEKREERRHQEKDEHIKNFLEVKKNKLRVDGVIARPRAKEIVLKHKEVSLTPPTDKA